MGSRARPAPARPAAALRALRRSRSDAGGDAGPRKLALLRALDRAALPRAADVLALHETLCWLRAWPDDAEVLALVERMLDRFAARRDLRRFADELADSGIAGTVTRFRFFPATAGWLARRWGPRLTVDWDEFERSDRLEPLLGALALDAEGPGLDVHDFGLRGWIGRLAGPGETDAAFLLRRLGQLDLDPRVHDALLEELDAPFVLAPGPDTPARTRERLPVAAPAFRVEAPRRARPDVRAALARPPGRATALPASDARRLVDLARGAMAVRSRDLDAFAHGDPRDVRLVEAGDGLQIAFIGVTPARRLLLETLYGFLALQNGVPVGYGTFSGLFGSAEVAFTVFDTYRSGESASIYVRALAAGARLLGFDTLMVDPYQLGQDNDDAIASGAWWFYQKLGFRPRERELLAIMRREQARMRARPGHRSSAATLRRLADAAVYLHLRRRRDDVLGVLPLGGVGLAVTRMVSERFGHDRRRAERECAREAAVLLGVRRRSGWSAGERLAWTRWSPLVLALPGVRRWSAADRRRLAAVVRAKGGRRESDFLARFDRHRPLRQAVARLAQGG